MANNAFTQMALAADPRFRIRLQAALLRAAADILGEDGGTLNHSNRITYANKVLTHPDIEAAKAAPFLVMRGNVLGPVTSYDFVQGAVVNAATDDDLFSQVNTDWNWLANA